LVEQRIKGPIPDVLTLRLSQGADQSNQERPGGVAVATAPPRARLVRRKDAEIYAGKTNLITVRHRHGDVVAVIENVSPGNTATFVEKSANLMDHGVHLLVVDLFPPGKHDPQGSSQAIWEQLADEDLPLPPDKPLSLASYDAGPERVAYVEPVAVGDVLP